MVSDYMDTRNSRVVSSALPAFREWGGDGEGDGEVVEVWAASEARMA